MLKLGKDTKDKILNGVNTVANAVKATAGAKGKFALIEDIYGNTPHPTKDGITVLKSIDLKDQYEKLGAELLKQASIRTANQTGDGTTTTTILSQALINETFSKDVSHVELIRGLNKALKDTFKFLDKLKKKVSNKEMSHIATISANGDKEIGEKIAEIYKKAGVDVSIEVKEGFSTNTEVVYNEGMRLDRGWSFPHFSTDFSKYITKFEDCLILLYNDKIKTLSDIKSALTQSVNERRPLVIIADDVEEPVMASLIRMKRDGELQVCVCVSPEYGEYRKQIMEDIAFVTGAKVFDNNLNFDYELGTLKKFTATSEKSILLAEDSELISERIELLKERLISAEKTEEERVQKRISNLKASVVEVSVGGVTDLEIKEKKDRVEDAVPALKNAIEEGFVAGGGSTLHYIANQLQNTLEGGEKVGYDCFIKALQEPMKVILSNGGLSFGGVIDKYGYGIDVIDGKEKDMIKMGIIDPVKVTKMALENAVSVTSTALSTEVLILSKFL